MAKFIHQRLMYQVHSYIKRITCHNQVEFIPGMQGCFNIQKVNQCNSPHSQEQSREARMTNSVTAEIQHLIKLNNSRGKK